MRLVLAAALLLAACAPQAVTTDRPVATTGPFVESFPGWYAPAEPFRVIGNIHQVGPEGLGIFFIPTDDGHILIDGGVPENAPLVANNIEKLGYRVEDVAILLSSHAHFDHSGGLAELKRMSGAKLWASEGDRSALEGGFYLGWEDRDEFDAPPVAVDRVIGDGDLIEVGGVSLRAVLTPGHTRGCTSYLMTVRKGGEAYETLFFCSASVAANRLADPPQYDGIVQDYRATFARMKALAPDVFLANHPDFFGMAEKRERQLAGDALAFVDRETFPAYTARVEADFEKRLAEAMATAD